MFKKLTTIILTALLILQPFKAYSFGSDGCTSSVVLLSHYDGPDAAVTTTDEDCDGNGKKSYTFNANAQLDIDSKFGSASALFDGTGDFLSLADSLDWQLDGGADANEWGIDFWVKFTTSPGGVNVGFITQFSDVNNQWNLLKHSSGTLDFSVVSAGSTIVFVSGAWVPTTGVWYHVALMKNGVLGYRLLINGSQIGSTTIDTSTIPNYTGGLKIGTATRTDSTVCDLNGRMDEVRVTKGRAYYKAVSFTSPTTPYCSGCEMQEVLHD